MPPTAVGVRTAVAALTLLLAPPTARAQAARDSAVVTGTVRNESGAPIGNAIVAIRRLQLSATTSEAGTYRLIVSPGRFIAGTETLSVTRLGFRPASVPFTLAPGSVTVDATLASQAIALDQVVVTGTAGNQERRAQAAVVSTIDAADIMNKAPVVDANELLYARTPGVSMTRGSGTSGANTRIDIRGQASVSLSNYPLIFVDGVRVLSGPRSVAQAPGGTTAGAGGQQFNALNDIAPDDIESIEVVKGPAASTLYGSDASAGVIQIFTKKGRAGQRHFSQGLVAEYDDIDPNFTPYDNFGACPEAFTAPDSPNPLCRGQTPGTVVRDNVLLRNDVFDHGWHGRVQYTAQGGGENFGYYGSFSAVNEQGTTPGSSLRHRFGRVNANWIATPKLSFDVTVPLERIDDRMPQGDQSSFGYLVGGDFGSPLSVSEGPGGRLGGGWFNNNLSVEAISAIDTRNITLRSTPSVQGRYSPLPWFTNRLTLGADVVRTRASQMFPRNDQGWYSAVANTGSVSVNDYNTTIYTVDYLGNVTRSFGRGGRITSDLSFGAQWINTLTDVVGAAGQGLLTNSNNLISAATLTFASQDLTRSKSLGFFVQEQLGFGDRLFVQLGARGDRNSAFGSSVGTFFLPKAGVSYVISEEPFWRQLAPVLSTFRLRAAYGTTGRSPAGTAALQTYSRANFVTDQGVVQPGISPGSPGNPNLEPERGTEFEAGFDAGLFNDRAGIELTYFSKTSKDLLLPQPLAPSSGFSDNPLVNIGEVSNRGLELSLRATALDLRNLTWDATLNVNTLRNRIESMGSISPFIANNQCFKPGVEVAAWCVPVVLGVDTVAEQAVVSDTAAFAGGQLPRLGGSLFTTLTFFRRFRLYALADGKFRYRVYNLTKEFRDRFFANSAEAALPAGEGGYSKFEIIRRFGPYVGEESGNPVGTALVRGPYIVPGDYVRLRELSLTWSVPPNLLGRLSVSGASLTVGGTNLALWTKYDGWDPEALGTPDIGTPFLADVFTQPQARRFFARLNVQF